jgi:Peptidase C13 family
MSFRRHVNGLEFCYRILVDCLGFATENIYVLNYDGSLQAFGDTESGSYGVWPGDGTAYRMHVNADGSREAFREVLATVGAKLTPDDQLFINTTGHGGHHGDECGPDLLTHPNCQRYRRDEFCADLATLPPHRALVVLMTQCFSGGFNRAVIDASRAESTFIASATSETRPSFATDDLNWDSFQRNWVAGLAGRDVEGTAIPGNVGGRISVADAFRYATTCPSRSLYDSPQFAARPAEAGALTLA